MTLDEIPQVCKADATPQLCMIPDINVFILPLVPSLMEEHEERVKLVYPLYHSSIFLGGICLMILCNIHV